MRTDDLPSEGQRDKTECHVCKIKLYNEFLGENKPRKHLEYSPRTWRGGYKVQFSYFSFTGWKKTTLSFVVT